MQPSQSGSTFASTEKQSSLVSATAGLPKISVIIPARNEQASLGKCLRSLISQQGVSFEIIVVDDASTDATRRIAESFPTVRVVEAGPLPEGWSGKSNAAMAGARLARGEWFLFTDADTAHLPGSLRRALAEALEYAAALLSYSPRQELRGLAQRAVMPVIFAELACTYRPRDVGDPNSPVAAANGQYLLISRAAYEEVGGHAAIAHALLEDVELASAVKARGRRLHFRYGGDAVSTRMYNDFAQLREGWTKNLVLLFKSPVRLAVLRLTEFVGVVGGATLAVLTWHTSARRLAMFSAPIAALVWLRVLWRVRKAHAGPLSSALALLGLPLFSYLLLRSRLYYKWGRVTWRGRHYAAASGHQHAAGSGSGESTCPATGE